MAGVLRDWEREAPWFEGPPTTLAFGGGTPSRADPRSLAAVVEAVRPSREVGMEANPEDVSRLSVRAWRDLGVSRLSLGVQTFNPALAPALGRAHSARQALSALEAAMATDFRSVSVDLMFGQAGQTVEALVADLDTAASAGVHHLSLYSLTVEPGTRFAVEARAGVDEDRWVELHDAAALRLEELGFERYEVSNFARPGHRAEHNEHYWRARHWAGLGPSGHGWRPNGERTANAENFDEWASGSPPAVERPGGSALFFELVWSTLRHIDGVNAPEVVRLTGFRVMAPDRLLNEGLLRWEGDHLRLSTRGFAISDAVVAAVVAWSCS